MDISDVLIVGAGPAGLAASIYALERKLKVCVLEAHRAGGQLVSLYPEKAIYDFPSYIEIKAKDLAQKMIAQAEEHGAEINFDTAVDSITSENKLFTTSTGSRQFIGKAVILATGMGHYSPRRLGIPGETELENKGVSFQKIPERVVGKRVVIVGGGDTAAENAILAAQKGAAVTIVHRRDTFRAQETSVDQAKKLSIQMLMNSNVVGIQGTERVESIEVVKGTGARSFLSCDLVVLCLGVELKTDFLGKLGVKVDRQAVVVDADMQTSIPGIFACGDITVPAGKYRRISVAIGSAATAINGVYQYLKNPYWKQE